MTVDGGDWLAVNQSQEWSSNYTGDPDASGGYPPEFAFDGQLSTTCYPVVSAGNSVTWTFSSLTGTKFEVSGLFNDSYPPLKVNGSDISTVGTLGAWTDISTEVAGQLTGLTILSTGESVSGLSAVRIDGKILIDTSVTPPGETVVTGPPLIASANDVEYLDGNTLGVNGVSGTWLAGLHAQGAEVTATAPSPESIQYTSANGTPLTTPFTGTDASLTTRTWTWQVSNAVTGPWSDFATRVDAPGQDGAVPLAGRPTLEPNKFYQVKVRYDSSNAEFVESTFNTFKTGDN